MKALKKILVVMVSTCFLMNGFMFTQQGDEDMNRTEHIFKLSNVGVGTIKLNPHITFHVVGKAIFESPNWNHFDIKTSKEGTDAVLRLYDGNDFWAFHNDDSNNNCLDIRFNNFSMMRVTNDGNVGIGTTNPDKNAKLHVKFPEGSDEFNYLKIESPNKDNIFGIAFVQPGLTYYLCQNIKNEGAFGIFCGHKGTHGLVINKNGHVGIGTRRPQNKLDVDGGAVIGSDYSGFETAPYNGLLVEGNVGIGTTMPGAYKLAVNGNIRAKEIVVDTGWSDFVFEDNYELMNLNKVEDYIEENGHLPDIPSAKQIEVNGVSLGKSQALLLQKIEELTLYIIEQNKRINKLEQEVAAAKRKDCGRCPK